MGNKPHILVVDDHREVRDGLAKFMIEHGFRVSTAPDGKGMRRILEESRIDLIVLDLMLPGEDGLTLCRELRGKSSIPVVTLTAMGEGTDRIVGLEMGTDDYVAKPFNPRGLFARVKAVLRRAKSLPESTRPPDEKAVKFDTWTFNLARRELEAPDGTAVPLSTGEFNLLRVFVRHPGHVLSRDQILDLTQGREATPFDRSIDTQVSRLRRKIEALGRWLTDAGASPLASFVAGTRADRPAVKAALRELWSSGQVEGTINKLKLLKRQMYGRAKADLLEARLMSAA